MAGFPAISAPLGLIPERHVFLSPSATSAAEQFRTATIGGLADVPPFFPDLMVIGAVTRRAVERAPVARPAASSFATQQLF